MGCLMFHKGVARSTPGESGIMGFSPLSGAQGSKEKGPEESASRNYSSTNTMQTERMSTLTQSLNSHIQLWPRVSGLDLDARI